MLLLFQFFILLPVFCHSFLIYIQSASKFLYLADMPLRSYTHAVVGRCVSDIYSILTDVACWQRNKKHTVCSVTCLETSLISCSAPAVASTITATVWTHRWKLIPLSVLAGSAPNARFAKHAGILWALAHSVVGLLICLISRSFEGQLAVLRQYILLYCFRIFYYLAVLNSYWFVSLYCWYA